MTSSIQDGYDRVTDILSPFSGMDKIPMQILENAAKRGSLVHSICEQIIEGFEDVEIEPHVAGYIESFSSWNEGKKYLKPAERLYCDELKITGLCDCLYELDGDIYLVDFKTSAREGSTWYLQGAAYKYLLSKKGYQIKAIEFVQLDKNGKPAKSYFYDNEGDFEKFIVCLHAYRMFFKDKDPENGSEYI